VSCRLLGNFMSLSAKLLPGKLAQSFVSSKKKVMDYTTLALEVNEGIALLTIARPEKLNALNKQTIEEISEALESLRDNSSVRILILTGGGEKAFVAGADISEFADFNPQEGKALAAEGQQKLFDKVARFPKPVIAAINGFALGGGLELAMAAHVRIASENAKMGLPELSLGLIPGYGGTQRLAQLIGKGRAFEWLFSAGMWSAQDALSYGLVNHVVPQNELLDTAKSLANRFMKNSSMAMAAAIQAVNAGYEDGVNGYAIEVNLFGQLFGTPEFKEGTEAFLQKRKPDFNR
jgi:enoyl-CoA hydratase